MQTPSADSVLSGHTPSVNIRIHAAEEGGYTAECMEIPGCFSEGDTEHEAEINIRKAIDACLSVIFEDFLNKIHSDAAAESSPGVSGSGPVTRQESLPLQLPRLVDAA